VYIVTDFFLKTILPDNDASVPNWDPEKMFLMLVFRPIIDHKKSPAKQGSFSP
jgi:hypothetical protein